MTMRWVGSGCDLVTLEQIRQVPGVSGVITALHGVPVGIVWETAHIRALQIEKMEAHNAPY
jgi:mannonate dehydratase